MAVARSMQRARNALRRLTAGLPAGGRTISPEVPNDLFQAHRSLYLFAAGFARGREVLDLGCGTGYGSAELRRGGAASVTGLDREPRGLRYARRRFGGLGVRFVEGDAEDLPADLGDFDLVAAVSVLPQLASPAKVLAELRRHLRPGGELVASLPPILDGQTLTLYQTRTGDPSSLYLWDWLDLLREELPELRLFRHLPPAGRLPDLGSPAPSSLDAEGFRFEEIPLTEIDDVGSLTAVLVGRAG